MLEGCLEGRCIQNSQMAWEEVRVEVWAVIVFKNDMRSEEEMR